MNDLEINNGDLVIKNGDFSIIESTNQHQKHLIIASKGDFKEFPEVGVGIHDYLLNDADLVELRHSIQSEFEKDGMKINNLTIDANFNIDISAEYKKDERS